MGVALITGLVYVGNTVINKTIAKSFARAWSTSQSVVSVLCMPSQLLLSVAAVLCCIAAHKV